jgi:hypothetical protein
MPAVEVVVEVVREYLQEPYLAEQVVGAQAR